jgi:hypothetical protein
MPDGSKVSVNLQARLDMEQKDWPTQTAGDAKASGSRETPESQAHDGISLTDAAVYGHAAGRRDQASPSTNGRSSEWSTPQAHDQSMGDARRVGRYGTAAGGRNLNDEVMAPGTKGRLNHRWVCQLMNFPADWLDLDTGDKH